MLNTLLCSMSHDSSILLIHCLHMPSFPLLEMLSFVLQNFIINLSFFFYITLLISITSEARGSPVALYNSLFLHVLCHQPCSHQCCESHSCLDLHSSFLANLRIPARPLTWILE